MTNKQWEYISNKSLELFTFGQQYAFSHGLILVDTKYEFGVDKNGDILLVDELHTCDSSRFWLADTYAEKFNTNQEPDKYDKDLIRDYIKTICDPYTIPIIPDIPYNILHKVSIEYIKFYYKLFSQRLEIPSQQILHVIIIAGSITDKDHVDNIITELHRYNLNSIEIYQHIVILKIVGYLLL
jgi:phosphoribosylaminoimidazole-succinocarboxamide synthase